VCEFSVSSRPCDRRRKILSEYSDPCACRARRRRPLLHCERGAVAIEFALVIGLLIALVLGILQIGLAIQQRGAMERTLSLEIRRAQIDEGAAPEARKAADHARLNALLGLAEAPGCRRQVLLGYFGEDAAPCGNCDTCAMPVKLFNATEPVRKALSAVLRTGENFGAGHLIDILTGTATDKVRTRGHDRLPTFAVGRELARGAWQGVFRQMMAHDLIRPDPARHGALRMTEAARPVLRGETEVMLREDAAPPRKDAPARAEPAAIVSEDDAPLLAALKAKRRELAEAAGMPAYIVFNDRTLIEMAEARPDSLDAMARISGVGATKLERYGAAFLEVITGAAPPPQHPARRKLAGRPEGALLDRLHAIQRDLARGPDGTEKPLSLSTTTLRRIAQARPDSPDALARIPGMDAARTARFGPALLDEISNCED